MGIIDAIQKRLTASGEGQRPVVDTKSIDVSKLVGLKKTGFTKRTRE